MGLEQAVDTALEIARPGGAIGRAGVPVHDTTPTSNEHPTILELAANYDQKTPAQVFRIVEELTLAVGRR